MGFDIIEEMTEDEILDMYHDYITDRLEVAALNCQLRLESVYSGDSGTNYYGCERHKSILPDGQTSSGVDSYACSGYRCGTSEYFVLIWSNSRRTATNTWTTWSFWCCR